MVFLRLYIHVVKIIPEAVFLHLVFKGEGLQVTQLVEGHEVLDQFRGLLYEGLFLFLALIGDVLPNISKEELK